MSNTISWYREWMLKSGMGWQVLLTGPFIGITVGMTVPLDVAAAQHRLDRIAVMNVGLAFRARQEEDHWLFGLWWNPPAARRPYVFQGSLAPTEEGHTRIVGQYLPDGLTRTWAVVVAVLALLSALITLVGLPYGGVAGLIVTGLGVLLFVARWISYLRNFERVMGILAGTMMAKGDAFR